MTSHNVNVAALLIWFTLCAAAVTGWILNVVTIAHTGLSDMTGMLILRVVGIFMLPLGAILGYF